MEVLDEGKKVPLEYIPLANTWNVGEIEVISTLYISALLLGDRFFDEVVHYSSPSTTLITGYFKHFVEYRKIKNCLQEGSNWQIREQGSYQTIEILDRKTENKENVCNIPQR